MNILFINEFYFPNVMGGTENSIKILAEGLRKRGHNVYIYTLDGLNQRQIFQPEIINNVVIFRGYDKFVYQKYFLKNKSCWIMGINYLKSFKNNKALSDITSIINKYNIDVINTNNCREISYMIWKYASDKKLFLCHTLRDYWLLDPRGKLGATNRMFICLHKKYYKKFSNKYIKYITAPSKNIIDNFEKEKYFCDSIKKCIVNCVEMSIEEVEENIRVKQMRKCDKYKFLYAGNLEEYKGVKRLIEAIHKITEKNVEFYFCGDGSMRQEIELLAESDVRVTYLGKLNREELKQVYQVMDVVIVPSIWEEPFGRVIIEGAKYGNAVIASDKGGMPEIMQNLNCGQVYDAEDTEQLKNVILQMCNRNEIRKCIKNLRIGLQIYSVDNQLNAFEKLYFEGKKKSELNI